MTRRLIPGLLLLGLLCMGASWGAGSAGSGTGDTRSAVLARAAGMQQNYDRVNDYAATMTYEFQHDGTSTTYTVREKWAKPGIYLEEWLSASAPRYLQPQPGAPELPLTPLMRTSFDGKVLTTESTSQLAEHMEQIPGMSMTGAVVSRRPEQIDCAMMDPRPRVWGAGTLLGWKHLSSMVEAGQIVSVRPETQFGVAGTAIEAVPHAGMKEYIWIDDSHGDMPRIWIRQSEGIRGEMRVAAVESSGGVWFPVELSFASISDNVRQNGPSCLALWKISSLAVNGGLRASDLALKLKPGTPVLDRIHNRKYVVGESEPSSTSWLKLTGLGGGVILVVAGGAWLFVRRRRSV